MSATPYKLTGTPLAGGGDLIVNATLVDDGAAADGQQRQEPPPPPEEPLPDKLTTFTLVECILKHPRLLQRLLRQPSRHSELVPRLLGIAVAGFTLFGIVFTIILTAAGVIPQLNSLSAVIEDPLLPVISFEDATRFDGSWVATRAASASAMVFAYTFGLIAATGICLPSLYFYGLLAGVRMTWLDVVLHALKAKATAAIALVGIVPIYLAAVLGVLLFNVPAFFTTALLWGGCILPFIAGAWGTASLYDGFLSLNDTIDANQRYARTCFLRRLVVSWCLVYTAVCPVMIHAVWNTLAG